MAWLALEPLSKGELRLPFGVHQLAPISGYDVAEAYAKILADPAPHISKSYELNGPELKDMHGLAEDFAAVLGRQVTYVPEEVETWNATYVDTALAEFPHTTEHMKTLPRLIGGGGNRGVTDLLETLPRPGFARAGGFRRSLVGGRATERNAGGARRQYREATCTCPGRGTYRGPGSVNWWSGVQDPVL